MTPDPNDLAAEIHAHLAATEELPVDPHAGRWIGEAQAVAADARAAPPDVATERIAHVAELLDRVDDPGSPAVARRVALARDLAERVRE